MLHTALGHPHWGEGARGLLQFLTSRPHSLIGEQPYVGCAWWESCFRFGRPLPDRPWHSPPSVLISRDGAVLPNEIATAQLCLHRLVLDRLVRKPTWDDCLLWSSLKTDFWAPT